MLNYLTKEIILKEKVVSLFVKFKLGGKEGFLGNDARFGKISLLKLLFLH